MRSLKEQSRIIKTAATKNALTKTFIFDERWQRPNPDNTVYPLVNVWSGDFLVRDGMIRQPYEMMVVNYADSDGTDRLENLSDCQLLTVDILSILQNDVSELDDNGPVIKVSNIGAARKVIDDEADGATGWLITFELEQKYDRDYCSYPGS